MIIRPVTPAQSAPVSHEREGGGAVMPSIIFFKNHLAK